jgi:hypothetical protein
MMQGASFDVAFATAIGRSTSTLESDFWKRQRIWTTWVPIVTSSATVWFGISLIAMLAIRRRRQKDAEIARTWDEEETDQMSTPLNMHAARTALNQDPELRQWAEQWLKDKERATVGEMSDDEFEKHWRYVRPERMHDGAIEAVTAYRTKT